MQYIKSLRIRYPVIYYAASVLIIIGVSIGFYQLVKAYWYVAAILSGLLIIVSVSLVKHVRPSVWSVAANIGAAMAYIWVFSVFEASWWVKCLVMFLFMPLFVLANWALKFDVAQDMRRRSKRATKITKQVMSQNEGDLPMFGFYLRPFISTDRLPTQTLDAGPGMSDSRASNIDFETILQRSFYRQIDLIALGRPEDIHEGIARVVVQDDEWQDVAAKLMDKATFIIAVPLAYEGTIWEMKELKDKKYLDKTVFLMPEILREQPSGVIVSTEDDRAWDAGISIYNPSAHTLNIGPEWKKVREKLKPEGLELPPYSPTGAFFTLHPDTGQVRHIAPLPLSVLEQRAEYIQTVLAEFGLLPWRAMSNLDLLRLLVSSTFQSKKNKEYVLALAFDMYITIGDAATASIILQMSNLITREHPQLIDQMIAGIPRLMYDPNRYEFIVDNYQDLKLYVDTLRNTEGINRYLAEEASAAFYYAVHQLDESDR